MKDNYIRVVFPYQTKVKKTTGKKLKERNTTGKSIRRRNISIKRDFSNVVTSDAKSGSSEAKSGSY